VDDFVPSKSQKRVQRRNRNLIAIEKPPLASDAQFELLRAYLDTRHNDGGMAEMTPHDYQSMVQDSPISSSIIEYRIGSELHINGPLAGACVTDRLDDGLSMVYSFFDPSLQESSLGTYMILDHVRLAKQKGLPYLYLGYWINGCGKMDYKRRFAPLEFLKGGTWASASDHKIDFKTDEPLHEL
jgi:arginine-tRNA-protein transferase